MSSHLPNEIWDQIIRLCDDPRDVWLSLRPTSHQLRLCVEKYFTEHLLGHFIISLPMKLPTYDARNQVTGHAIFHHQALQPAGSLTSDDDGMVVFKLAATEPDDHGVHFLGRWSAIANGGYIPEHTKWDVHLPGHWQSKIKLKDCQAVVEDGKDDEARMKFEWKPTLTAFWR